MTKLEVQKRVLKNGEHLALHLFEWDEKTNTFSSNESGLVLDFKGINNCAFKTGSYCAFKTGSYCAFKTGYDCTFNTGSNCTFNTGSNCVFNTGSNCVFNTCWNCTFKTGSNCTFKTGSNCTFKTGDNCTFDTGDNCTFDTGWNCTFNTGSNCTFKTGKNSVIVRRDVFEVIALTEETNHIRLNPYEVKGYLVLEDDSNNNIGTFNNERYIIADNILSKIISKKGNYYKVVNYNEYEISYIVEDNNTFSHGKTLKEAQESLIYKITERDLSKYENISLDTEITFNEAITMYRSITGACEYGTKSFIDSLETKKDKYTIKEIIEITKGQYGNEKLKEFIEKV